MVLQASQISCLISKDVNWDAKNETAVINKQRDSKGKKTLCMCIQNL